MKNLTLSPSLTPKQPQQGLHPAGSVDAAAPVSQETLSASQESLSETSVENCGSVDSPLSPSFPSAISPAQVPPTGPDSGLVSGPGETVAAVETAGHQGPNPHVEKRAVDSSDDGAEVPTVESPGRAEQNPQLGDSSVDDGAVSIGQSSGLTDGFETDADDDDGLNVIPEADLADLEHDLHSPKHPNYEEGGPWAYANEVTSRIFFITQYEKHEASGTELLSQATVEKFCAGSGIKRFTWIRHDKDTLTAKEARESGRQPGELKGAHFHIAVEMKNAASIGSVARKLGIAPQYVEAKKGRGVFMDLNEYMTHEHPKQLAKGKHRYDDAEVHTSIENWREQLNEHIASRSASGKSRKLAERQDEMCLKILRGEWTLRQARQADDEAYAKCSDRARKMRGEYLAACKPPEARVNFYFNGPGGSGKTVLAKALAKSLYPDLDDKECYFIVGADGVGFQHYDGQPVVIYDDFRAVDFVGRFGRGDTFKMFDQHPNDVVLNIKYGSVSLINTVSIVTGIESYRDFCDGLAGTYVDRLGNKHIAEDDRQSYRRFPFFVNVGLEWFEWHMNRGFVDNIDYHSSQRIMRVEQSLRNYSALLDTLDDASRDEVIKEVGDAWFGRVLELASPEAVARAEQRTKAEVLGELIGGTKVRLPASESAEDNEFYDLGDGQLRAKYDLYEDQIEGLAAAPHEWYLIARARFVLDELKRMINSQSYVIPGGMNSSRELRIAYDEHRGVMAQLIALESQVSQHSLHLGTQDEATAVMDALRKEYVEQQGNGDPSVKGVADFVSTKAKQISDWVAGEAARLASATQAPNAVAQHPGES